MGGAREVIARAVPCSSRSPLPYNARLLKPRIASATMSTQ